MPEAPRRTRRQTYAKRPLLKSLRFWVPVGILLLLIVLGAVGAIAAKTVADRAFAARDALQAAIPLASTAKDQILESDTDGAKQTVARLAQLSEEAKTQADGGLWRAAELVPVAGANLIAVREVAATVDDLVQRALTPATDLSLARLAPVDGRIDVTQLDVASGVLDQASAALTDARTTIDSIDPDGLIDQVASGVRQLDEALADIEPVVAPAQQTLAVLPGILGAESPRNYLVLVQNNAESRGTGGNPASLVMITADKGAISITEQASSADFDNGRPSPIIDLDPATRELYGDKVGRYMQDVTTTPDFSESAAIMEAFWAEEFDEPVDGTLSIDPVALSYLMKATGSVTLQNGDVLDSENVVSTLLNDVYFRYADPAMQDAYFAAAAGAVFDSITSVSDPLALVDQVVLAVDEGRILYVPATDAEAEIIGGSRLTGELPSSNADKTVIGSYVNDITEGKLDYYMDTAVSVASDVCTAEGGAPTFTVASTLDLTLQPDQVAGLARYISPARFFPKGTTSTDLVLYGPVGASFDSVSVDGKEVRGRVVEHLGRPAVKVNVENLPASTHTVEASFTGAEGEYGPIEVWHTPMVRETPVTVESPGCGN